MTDSFRSINVDIWEEDVLLESDLIPAYHLDPASAAAEADKKSAEARGCINRSDPSGALQLILADPVYGGSDYDQAKESTLSTLLTVLNSVKATDIPSLLKSLSLDQRDSLMKWIYKGLSKPETGSSGILLAWHEKLTEIAGTGCIVRVMTDRRRI
ncbi:actin-related protein ARPC5 [Microstroma glucosiphilum]|uniref:Actin-related protein 2/3 complex subunit 5 n=1 Tax=Pseudomicrostroma glucosiphilum TaxID=1684307 RepID=A0A316TYH4_9BASI|nr:actin-related protein ARPC5 [Pseudomicrostroma glucosiphilum]PWN18339.1 actin-related protein ARPC5 [Pseudomicrostroma glucosiphilum]